MASKNTLLPLEWSRKTNLRAFIRDLASRTISPRTVHVVWPNLSPTSSMIVLLELPGNIKLGRTFADVL